MPNQIVTYARKVLTIERRAHLFQLIVPRRFWFPGVLALSQCHASIARMAGRRECARYESSCVDRWLVELTRHGSFPIPYRVDGAWHLQRTPRDEAGLLLCTVHLPLTTVMMRGCIDLGAAPDFVIAAPHNINRQGRWMPAGVTEGVKAISPGSGTMKKARAVLCEGGRFASMMDEDVGTPLRPALMRLAGSVRARVILCWAVMDATRTIVVTFMTAPYPIPDTEEKVAANLAVLEELRQRVLAGLQGQHWGSEADSLPAFSPADRAGSDAQLVLDFLKAGEGR